MKYKGVQYPRLKGKVIKQVRFVEDDEFTCLVMEFEDNTSASFHLKAEVKFAMEPETSSTNKVGDIVGWKVLRTAPVRPQRRK